MKAQRIIFAALAAATVLASCQKEENLVPAPGAKVIVTASIDPNATKGLNDTYKLTWEVGDVIKWAGNGEFTSEALKAEDITNEGKVASFTFPADLNAVDRTGWFYSATCCSRNGDEVDFTKGANSGNNFTQAAAGEMNKDYLFLHTGVGTVNIEKGKAVNLTMNLVGTVVKVLPFTTTYNEESVLSVKVSSSTLIAGTVVYSRAAGTYQDAAAKNYVSSNYLKVNLGTPYSLATATSKDASEGIYVAVPATGEGRSLADIEYLVETNRGTYSFKKDGPVTFAENTILSVPLNLDKVAPVVETGYVRYDGALNNTLIPTAGCTDMDAGYWQALTSDSEGGPWNVRINAENAMFYSNVQFSYADEEGNPVDWISVKYGGGDLCHWIVNAKENEGAERKVVVTATYPDVQQCKVVETSKTKSVTFTQKAAGAKKEVKYWSVSLPASVEWDGISWTDKSAGYCLLGVDGKEYRDWTADGLYARSKFVYLSEERYNAKNYESDVDWLSCRYPDNGTTLTDCVWLLTAGENNEATARVAYVVCLFPEDAGYEFPEPKALKVTQKANTKVEASFSNVYVETVPAAGATITAAKLALTVNGVAQSDVAAAISTYGITVSADKGATVSVAADGVVTLIVPENPYKNGGVTYTITVKSTTGVVATTTVQQAEGEDESVPTCAYTYDLEIVNKAFGYPAHQTDNNANWAYIRNVKKDGVTVEITQEIADEVLAFAYRTVAPTDEEKAAVNQSGKTSTNTGVTPRVRWFGGVQIDVALDSGESGEITKVEAYNSDGSFFGSFITWID